MAMANVTRVYTPTILKIQPRDLAVGRESEGDKCEKNQRRDDVGTFFQHTLGEQQFRGLRMPQFHHFADGKHYDSAYYHAYKDGYAEHDCRIGDFFNGVVAGKPEKIEHPADNPHYP